MNSHLPPPEQEGMQTLLQDKMTEASALPSFGIEFDAEEAELAGFFIEDALSEDDLKQSFEHEEA